MELIDVIYKNAAKSLGITASQTMKVFKDFCDTTYKMFRESPDDKPFNFQLPYIGRIYFKYKTLEQLIQEKNERKRKYQRRDDQRSTNV